MTEDVYKSLKKRAKGIINKYTGHHFTPEELISETFLKFGELQEDIFSKKMNEVAGWSKICNLQRNETGRQEDRICRICGDLKEADWFRRWYVRGYLIFDSYCIKCRNKYNNDFKKEKRRVIK